MSKLIINFFNLKQFILDSSMIEHDFKIYPDIDAFVNDTNNYLYHEASSIITELRKLSNNLWDSSRLANSFENFSQSRREEDISNKLAWYLKLDFISDFDERIKTQSIILNGLHNYLQYDHISEKQKRPLPLFRELRIYREVTSQITGQRIDLWIENELNQTVLGVEVKIGDTNYEKSNNDLKEVEAGGFWLIVTKSEYERIKQKVKQQDLKLNTPVLIWEDIYHYLKYFIDEKPHDPFYVFTQMFLSSIELYVLDILPRNLSFLLTQKKLTPSLINKMAQYASFRKYKRVNNES